MVLKPLRTTAGWFSLPFLKEKASMVFVIAQNGQPLMPTRRYRKVRIWLKQGQAKVVRRKPFTIQLLFETTLHVQNLVLGMDIGYETIGMSVRDEKQEFFSSEVQLRTDVTEKITEKRMYRRNRRNRNTHYRKSRFMNRRKNQTIAPTIAQKVHSHLALLEFVKKLLPIGKVIIESNSFDLHKLKNPDVEGNCKEYQRHRQPLDISQKQPGSHLIYLNLMPQTPLLLLAEGLKNDARFLTCFLNARTIERCN